MGIGEGIVELVSRRTFHNIVITLAGILVICLVEHLGFFEGIDNYIYDTSFRLRGAKTPSGNILIVAIDERSLDALGRWPLRRIHYASLLERLREAKVVSLDLILSEPSNDDALLSEAIRKSGRVVLPVFIGSELEKISPLPSFSAARIGHVHVEQGIDNVAREVFHTLSFGGQLLPSFTSVTYETFTDTPLEREGIPSPVMHRTNKDSIIQTDRIKINYYGTPGTFRRISLSDVLDDRYPLSYFHGKAVLVGVTAQGLTDKVSTPFSQHRDKMPGVEVHANILNNLIDRSSIRDVDARIRWLACVALCFLFFLLFMKSGEQTCALLWILSLVVVSISSFLLFSLLNLWIAPFMFSLSFTYAYVLAYIFKLDAAAKRLDDEVSSVTALLTETGQGSKKEMADKGLVSLLSPGGINTKIQGLIQVEKDYKRILEDTVQNRTRELANALSTISSMSNEMIFRLSKAVESREEDIGGHLKRVASFSQKIAEILGMPPDFIEVITFASMLHDIGKIGIPDRILMKSGRLDSEEKKIMETHTLVGAKILSGSFYPKMQMSASIALNHHERWDGTGYPNGLKGEAIPVEARIVTICDQYDALRSSREYKAAFDHERSFKIITEGDGTTSPGHFDPEILRVFIKATPLFNDIFLKYQE
ncbi:MAG TPA: CHASE2 domain-containing protein [Thermodesulfovibrionales bacterium]|nr:CHASE2 domain-containing protein [Thermodesulfovibrionales bacterium]